MLRSAKSNFELRLPERYDKEYSTLFDEGVPMDLSLANLLQVGLRRILGVGDARVVPSRSPAEELSRLRGELARLTRSAERTEAARDVQLGILDQYQADKTMIDEALLLLERRIFDLQKLLGMDIIAENEGRNSQ